MLKPVSLSRSLSLSFLFLNIFIYLFGFEFNMTWVNIINGKQIEIQLDDCSIVMFIVKIYILKQTGNVQQEKRIWTHASS